MHKKYYFATTLVLIGILTGILAFTGLGETGFANRGHVPIVAVISVSGAFIMGGILFIIFGGTSKK
jgi:hypothetical protein